MNKLSRKELDKFSQLVKDLDDEFLNMNHIQIAIRVHTRNRKDIPEEIKDLLCGRGEADGGLIYRIFQLLSNISGSIELAYRRGNDLKGDEQNDT